MCLVMLLVFCCDYARGLVESCGDSALDSEKAIDSNEVTQKASSPPRVANIMELSKEDQDTLETMDKEDAKLGEEIAAIKNKGTYRILPFKNASNLVVLRGTSKLPRSSHLSRT